MSLGYENRSTGLCKDAKSRFYDKGVCTIENRGETRFYPIRCNREENPELRIVRSKEEESYGGCKDESEEIDREQSSRKSPATSLQQNTYNNSTVYTCYVVYVFTLYKGGGKRFLPLVFSVLLTSVMRLVSQKTLLPVFRPKIQTPQLTPLVYLLWRFSTSPDSYISPVSGDYNAFR